jgi:quercetin dioxygenase-like cupin family protein
MRSIRAYFVLTALPMSFAAAQAPAIQWGPAPPVFAAGAKFAVLQGDPSKPGVYTVRLEMPNGYKVAPHFHPTDENVTVIKGTFLIGLGDQLDPAKTRTLQAGDFATAHANEHHFAIARGQTIVQVHGVGPFMLTYVNPADDPTKQTAKARK